MLRHYTANIKITEAEAKSLIAKAQLIARNLKSDLSLYGKPAQKTEQRAQFLEEILAFVVGIECEIDRSLRYTLTAEGMVGIEYLAADGERWTNCVTLTRSDWSVTYYHKASVNLATMCSDIARHLLDPDAGAFCYIGGCGRAHDKAEWAWTTDDGQDRSLVVDTDACNAVYAARRSQWAA